MKTDALGPRRFVLVTSQRSGSTMLVKSLDSSESVFCAGELFHTGRNVHHKEYQYPCRRAKFGRISRLLDRAGSKRRICSHLRQFYEQAGVGAEAVGFKLMVSHTVTFPEILPVLVALAVQHIYLIRRDVFQTALSYYKARVTGTFHSDAVRQSHPSSNLAVDDREFRRVLEVCKENKQRILKLHGLHGGLLLAYEDMISDWNEFVATISATLGIAHLQIQPAISRLRSGVESIELNDEHLLRERYRSVIEE